MSGSTATELTPNRLPPGPSSERLGDASETGLGTFGEQHQERRRPRANSR